MADQFLHGVEVVQIDNGARPIRTVRASVIGLIGTAPDADADKFPLNTPVLIAGRRSDAAGLGATGTLARAVDGIFDQAGAVIVLVRVEEGADEAATLANIIGGIDDDTGAYEGVQAFLAANSKVGVTPRLLIAPGFTDQLAAANEMLGVAERLRAHIIVDGPNTNDADAIAYRDELGSRRFYLVDPAVTVFDTEAEAETVFPASACVAGLIAKSDADRGYWTSPSNQVIAGITGTARAVDFAMGDPNSRANLLNEQEVATIIQEQGFRLWGNRTCSPDPKYTFLNVSRTVDVIGDSIQAAHLWAVDRNITRNYLEDVVEGVNAFLRHLRGVGAIIDGRAWADEELNSAASFADGRVYINFDFSVHSPAERLTFRSHLVNDYQVEILPV